MTSFKKKSSHSNLAMLKKNADQSNWNKLYHRPTWTTCWTLTFCTDRRCLLSPQHQKAAEGVHVLCRGTSLDQQRSSVIFWEIHSGGGSMLWNKFPLHLQTAVGLTSRRCRNYVFCFGSGLNKRRGFRRYLLADSVYLL